MIDAKQAQTIVLRHCEGDPESPNSEHFVIQSCELSPKGDYWVVRANSKDYVLHGRFERCYVGVNAYLVDPNSGKIDTVSSGQSCEQFLQDKYDLINAGEGRYVVVPVVDKADKASLIHLRQKIDCSLQTALQLVSPQYRSWFTGKLRVLKQVQQLLEDQAIKTAIELWPNPADAVEIDERLSHWGAVQIALQGRCSHGMLAA